MKKFLNSFWLKRITSGVLIAVVLFVFQPTVTLNMSDYGVKGISNEQPGLFTITIGDPALGAVDIPEGALNASACFNAAITSVQAHGGGQIIALTFNHTFTSTVQVPANIQIVGFGPTSRLSGVTPTFNATGDNISFSNLWCAANTTINMGSTAGWTWYNVFDGTNKYDFRNSSTSVIGGVVTATQLTAPTGNITQNLTAANATITQNASINYLTVNGSVPFGFYDSDYRIIANNAPLFQRLFGSFQHFLGLPVSVIPIGNSSVQTIAIQSALTDAGNATRINFSSGTYNITAHPTISEAGQIPGLWLANVTNILISGQGSSTIFACATNNSVWAAASSNNLTFRDFAIYGNNNSAFSLQTGIALYFGNDNIRIQNVDITGTGYDAIYGLASCTNVLVEENRITNAGDDGVNPGGGFGTETGPSNWRIVNNIISGVKNDGLHLSIGSWGISADGNLITNCGNGIGIFNSNNHTISNNKIYNVANGIITLSGTCAYLNIDNNYIENVSVVGINLAHASTYSKVTNNKLINITDRAIFIQGGSTYVLVDGNQISTALRGVQFADVAGTVTNNHISGVSAYGVVYNIAAPTIGNALIANNNILGGGSANAIFLAGSNCSIVNNMLSGAWAGGAISPGAGTNNIIRGNWGYFTESSGNFTVSANTNTIAVTHGLALTPTDIQITFSGNTTGFVTAVGATTFNVTTTTNVTTNILGYWRAVVGTGN